MVLTTPPGPCHPSIEALLSSSDMRVLDLVPSSHVVPSLQSHFGMLEGNAKVPYDQLARVGEGSSPVSAAIASQVSLIHGETLEVQHPGSPPQDSCTSRWPPDRFLILYALRST
ncbi:hypothetical protein VNO77_08634 [Canavalia gladiata]|uniref:Uncharacterized protein n=1 Tax=Canavalia gladiata TaxID=3824 RepID=A0AAN9M9D2_CANGL